jgi:hypothetical protein
MGAGLAVSGWKEVVVWMSIGFGAIVVGVLAVLGFSRRLGGRDLGTVSHQWLSEHRKP